jgi:hypothetical protein
VRVEGSALNPTPSRPQRRAYQQTGLYAARRAVETFGSRALPGADTPLGQELQAWRASLIADLGGDPSTAQVALIDLAVRSKLMVDSVDAYLLEMQSLVDKRHRRLWPVVRERQALVNALQAILRDLGLERRAKDAEAVETILARLRTPPYAPTGDA